MKLHVLLIDDDKDELSIFLEALQKIPVDDGFKCTYAANAQQAIDMLKYLVPDFIFVDLNMPKMGGCEFLSAIKGDYKLQFTKKYLYSTKITADDAAQAQLMGASGCIEKTATMVELTKKLESIFTPVLTG